MRTLLSGLVVKVALVVAMTSAASIAHASGPVGAPPMQADAKKHFDAGVQAIQSKQWERARSQLLLAWQTEKHYRTAANLGRVEIELGRYREAAEHLAYCLRNETEMSAHHKAAVQELFGKALAQIGVLDVRTNVSGATVLVDGQVVGHTPLAAVFVEPGRRTITARMAGRTFEEKPVDIAAGKTEDVVIEERIQIASRPLQTTPPPERSSDWKLLAVPMVGVVALAGIGVGIEYTVALDEPNIDSQARKENWNGAAIGYAIGGTAAIATFVMAFWPTERSPHAGFVVSPIVGGGLGGVHVGGVF